MQGAIKVKKRPDRSKQFKLQVKTAINSFNYFLSPLMTLKKDSLYLKSLTPEAYYSEGFFQINTRPPICGGNFSKYLDAPGQSRHDWQLEQRQSPYVLTFKDAKDNSFYILKGWWRFSEVWCSDYWKVPVKYLLWPPGKTLPPGSQHHFQEEGNYSFHPREHFSESLLSSLPLFQ